jgi:hypothetical protein
VTVRPSNAKDRRAAADLNEIEPGDNGQRTLRTFEVTLLTTRCGTTAVVMIATGRDAATSTVRELIATGEYTAPPEHCTDDIQTEIWTIREVH